MEEPQIVLVVLASLCVLVWVFLTFIKHDKGPRDVEGMVASVKDRFSINQGWLISLYQKFRSRHQGEAIIENQKLETLVLSQKKRDMEFLLIDNELKMTPERIENGQDLERASIQAQKLLAENQNYIIVKATQGGFDAQTYVATEPQRQLDQSAVQREQGMSKIRREEHEDIENTNFDVYRRKKEIDVWGALIRELFPHFEAMKLMGDLDGLIAQERILLLNPEENRRKLRVIRKYIRSIEKGVDERAQLIQRPNRRELGGLDEAQEDIDDR